MRITTKMLNESAVKAGFPINQNSLLNYINNDSSENTLLEALNKKSNGTVNQLQKSKYEKMAAAAEKLQKKADLFLEKGESSLFQQAEKSGDKQEIYTNTEELVAQYNEIRKALLSSPDTLNNYYNKMLQEAASQNSEALSNIGITISKDGTLILDKEKLKATDIESVEKVLGASGAFPTRLSFLAEKISDKAEANNQATSSQYNSYGDIETMVRNRYDFWG